MKHKTPDYLPVSGASQTPSCIEKLQQPHSSHTVCYEPSRNSYDNCQNDPKKSNDLLKTKKSYLLVINNNFDFKLASRHLLQLQGLLLTFLNVNDVLVSLRFNVKSPTSAVIVLTLCPSSDA